MAYTDTQTNATTVVGVFEDYNAAERASRELVQNGIPQDSIQIQSNFRTGAAGSTGTHDGSSHEGGFMGWWHSLFSDDDDEVRNEGGHYAEAVRRGSAVLTVRTSGDMADQAAQIMDSAGAIDVDDRVAGWRESGYTGYNNNAEPYTHDQATTERDTFRNTANTGERATIPVVEEELQIGKRAVKRGGVRVYSRMTERPVNEQINLREEHVRVERRPVDRAISEAELSGLRDQSIEMTETVEEAVIGKRARVREEVVIGKETTERTEQVHDTVRRSEVQVDRINDTDATRGTGSYAGGRTTDEVGTRAYGDDTGTAGNYNTGTNPTNTATTGAYGAGSMAGSDYDTTAYQYGSRIAGDPTYRNRNWTDVENDIRSDYTRNNPGSEWDKVKASIRRGWDDITGKR